MGLRRRRDEDHGRDVGAPTDHVARPGAVDAVPTSREIVGGEHLRRSRPAPLPPTPHGERSFPGGRVRLPRIYGGASGTFVGTPHPRSRVETTDRPEPTSAFEEYFSYESLFEPPSAEDRRMERDNPYNVLGVKQSTPWDQIVAAHRAIVKANHPDPLIGMDEHTVAASTERLRRANEAYRALQAMRRELGKDVSAL